MTPEQLSEIEGREHLLRGGGYGNADIRALIAALLDLIELQQYAIEELRRYTHAYDRDPEEPEMICRHCSHGPKRTLHQDYEIATLALIPDDAEGES